MMMLWLLLLLLFSSNTKLRARFALWTSALIIKIRESLFSLYKRSIRAAAFVIHHVDTGYCKSKCIIDWHRCLCQSTADPSLLTERGNRFRRGCASVHMSDWSERIFILRACSSHAALFILSTHFFRHQHLFAERERFAVLACIAVMVYLPYSLARLRQNTNDRWEANPDE